MFARTLTAVAASGLLLATPAFAQAEPMTAEIEIADLDLSSDRGQARFQRRVVIASRQICGEENIRDFRLHQSASACANEVRADASQKLQVAMSKDGVKRIQVAARTDR